jgi:hypothetical protein
MDYEALLNLPDITHLFETERGSKYAQHSDATTTRNRSGAAHSDTTEGIQPRSGKTVYMDPTSAKNVAGHFQNPDMATKFTPVLDAEGKPTGRAALDLLADYGPKKAGTRLGTAPYETVPRVGLIPVEIMNPESKLGDTGRGVHFGNKIVSIKSSGGGSGGGADISFMKGMGLGKTPLYAKGGTIKMPKEYSAGSWKLI